MNVSKAELKNFSQAIFNSYDLKNFGINKSSALELIEKDLSKNFRSSISNV